MWPKRPPPLWAKAPISVSVLSLLPAEMTLNALLRKIGWTRDDWRFVCQAKDVKFGRMRELAYGLGVPVELLAKRLELEYGVIDISAQLNAEMALLKGMKRPFNRRAG